MAGRKKKEVVTQKRKNPCHHNFHFLPPSPLLNLRHQEEGDNVRGVGCNFPRLSTFPPPPPPPPSHSPHPFISFKWPFLFSFSLLPRLVIQTATAEATFSQLMAKRAANREERGRERERERPNVNFALFQDPRDLFHCLSLLLSLSPFQLTFLPFFSAFLQPFTSLTLKCLFLLPPLSSAVSALEISTRCLLLERGRGRGPSRVTRGVILADLSSRPPPPSPFDLLAMAIDFPSRSPPAAPSPRPLAPKMRAE